MNQWFKLSTTQKDFSLSKTKIRHDVSIAHELYVLAILKYTSVSQ